MFTRGYGALGSPFHPFFSAIAPPTIHRAPERPPQAFPEDLACAMLALLAENGLLHQAKIEDIVALGVAMEYVCIYITTMLYN